ncbi:basic helix-loop-helix domain-containing protein USF3 [Eleutherodactylus coqui]|uniref:basic helix-loop-helix domain-containing protein USF3 n=1 Tax=Eleutherodactylus coqui TaxID=57060 RepID=UPI003463076C
MPEMTQNASPNKTKHRKKNRESHNEVERHRKKKINSGINRIGDLIPCSPALKQSKNLILEQAFKYITELKRQNDELLLNGGNEEQASEIKKLRRELAEIQKENARYIELLKSNDICLYDDPTLNWKGNARNSKASLIAPVDQAPKLPLCLNGNQLSSSNQGTTVHGITFNMGHNLQKQTANVVPVQRTCNLVTPITIAGVYPLDKTWQQSSTSSTVAGQVESTSLPVTIAQSTANLVLSKSKEAGDPPTSSAAPFPLGTSTVGPITCSPMTAQEGNGVECGQNVDTVPKSVVSISSNIPSPVSEAIVPGISVQLSSNIHEKTSEVSSSVETGTNIEKEVSPAVDIGSSMGVVIHSREINPSIDVQAGSSVSILSGPAVETSWSLSSGLPDLKSVGSLSRIPSDGNTQTTWTTLQLAGNTVQPLSQSSSAVIPTPLPEQPLVSKDTLNNRPVTACINLNNVVSSEVKSVEQVMVKMSSCQPVQVQSLITQPQPQSTTGILPLHPPVQVIQVAQPFGTAINTSPANQNIILLQPPAPAPCPPVPKPPVGQQIVIIQATPNQSTLPLMTAQPTPSVVMPINPTNPVVCPSNTVQGTVMPQTFGGKHLVHILPRPTPVQPSSTAQQVPVSTATPNQQPPTISLNGQLFALQPMNPSAGSSNQTPMQIIQPTTSEDPNTNVALNTFGALANLSQNISQMAGQNCLQFTLNPPAPATLSSNTIPVNCVSVSGTSVTSTVADTASALPVSSVTTKPLIVKPVNTTSAGAKAKKTIKKPTAKKGTAPKKDSSPTTKPDSSCPELAKTQTNNKPQNEKEKVNVLAAPSSAEEKVHPAECQSSESGTSQKTAESRNSVLHANSEGNAISSEPKCDQPIPTHFPNPTATGTGQNLCAPQNEQRQSLEPECFKGIVGPSSHPVNRDTLQNTLVLEVPQESKVLTVAGTSDTVAASRPCQVEDSTTLTAADLLEAQILSDDPSEKSIPLKEDLKDLDSHGTLFRKVRAKEPPMSAGETRSEPVIPNTCVVQVAQNQSSMLEQDGGGNSSSATNRQTDSPLSNSSASSRNFSVASMLPDNNKDDLNGAAIGPPFNGCGFSEQNDIVAVAARAIFDQETLLKGRSRIHAEVVDSVPRNSEVETLPADCRLSFKPHSAKENLSRLPPSSNSFNALDTNIHPCVNHLVEKSNCSVVNSTSLSLQISASQSQSVTSLSINNLIHPGSVNHSVNCANVLQTSEHMSVPPSTNPSVSSNAFENQTQVTTVLSDYSHEQLHSMNSAVMQVSQATMPLLKQTQDARKVSNKRSAHEDELLSAAKRQKHCQTPLRLERLQPSDNVTEQNDVLVSHVSSDSSSAVSASSSVQSHGEGLSSLFTSNNNFVNPTLRQPDLRCSSQPSISEQGQIGNQHLQSLQSHQQQVPLHSNNPYLKQQQQAGHLRDHHHLYQQQQQVPHVDRSIRSQSHNIQQQRMIQQDVQMQKKQNSVQGAQAARMSLQQKHLTEQNRHKSSQHQQIQQQQIPSHFGNAQAEKTCENNAPSRGLHVTHTQGHVSQDILHQHQQDISRSQGSIVSTDHLSGHSQVQRLMTSRSLEQQMASQASVVSRPPNMICAPHRQERNRVSSYSAEALIGKSPSNTEQRIGVSVQASRVSEQIEMRKYLDVSRNKVIPTHNLQGHMSIEHAINSEAQRLPDCQTFKPGGLNQQQPPSFDVQTSRNNEVGTNANMRGLQSQTYRISQNPTSGIDRQKHLPYQTAQEVPIPNTLPLRENENSCHQSFMQSLLTPHLGDQVGVSQRSISSHQRTQYNSSSIEFSCPPTREPLHLRRDNEGQNRESCDLVMGQVNTRNNSLNIPFSSSSSSGDIQGRNTSPHSSMQKSNSVRQVDGQAKNQLNIQVSINMHGVVHPPIPHHSVSHGNGDQRQMVRQANPPVAQRSRHPLQDEPDSKTRQPERNRSGNQRHSNMFDSTLPHLPLAGPGSMILGRQQPVTEKRTGIVRFMPDTPQVSTDNPASDQHTLTQNFGFPFIPEGTMNPPINANASFIPPVTQTTATRTSALIPVDPQNTLPSFYPPYSPAHPSLSNDLTLPYFSNQMFPNPSTEKPNSNRFGSILSPPRPVGFSQTTFPLLPEMPPMHMANPSHLSNFNLTSLFPEIATALPADGSAVSPLLSISHPSSSDSSKQTSNRPAHNISHILGHDSSSAV